MVKSVINTIYQALKRVGTIPLFLLFAMTSSQLSASSVVYTQFPSGGIILDHMQVREAKRLGYAYIDYKDWKKNMGWKSFSSSLNSIFIGRTSRLLLASERTAFMAYTISFSEYCSDYLSDQAVELPFEKITIWSNGWSKWEDKETWFVRAEPEFAKYYLQFWNDENSKEHSLVDVFGGLQDAISGRTTDALEKTNAVLVGLEGFKEHYGCGSPEMKLLKENMIRTARKEPSIQSILRVNSTPQVGYEGARKSNTWLQQYIYTKPGWTPPEPKSLIKDLSKKHPVNPNNNSNIRGVSIKTSNYYWSDILDGYLSEMDIMPLDKTSFAKKLKRESLSKEVMEGTYILICKYYDDASYGTGAPVGFWLAEKPEWVSKLPPNHWLENINGPRDNCPARLLSTDEVEKALYRNWQRSGVYKSIPVDEFPIVVRESVNFDDKRELMERVYASMTAEQGKILGYVYSDGGTTTIIGYLNVDDSWKPNLDDMRVIYQKAREYFPETKLVQIEKIMPQ